jgi:hypothetical protein
MRRGPTVTATLPLLDTHVMGRHVFPASFWLMLASP